MNLRFSMTQDSGQRSVRVINLALVYCFSNKKYTAFKD